jgi:hypothetical protein
LIFVGGSNVAFGINGGFFSERLKRHPINMGLFGPLGLAFQIRLLGDYARPGDVILILPEYGTLTTWIEAEPRARKDLLATWPGGAPYLDANGRSWKTYLDRYALASFAKWVVELRRGLFSESTSSSVYARSSFNAHGDVVAHYGLPTSLDASRVEKQLFSFSCHGVAEAIRLLNEFHAVCRERGIELFFAYPPLPEQQFQNSRQPIRRLEQALAKGLTIPVLVSPEEMSYPLDHFFDTQSHLSEKGVRRRCELLVNRLIDRGVSLANRAQAMSPGQLR